MMPKRSILLVVATMAMVASENAVSLDCHTFRWIPSDFDTISSITWSCVTCIDIYVFSLFLLSHGQERKLQDPPIDFFDSTSDLCDNRPDGSEGPPQLGPCDTSRFPSCSEQQICYNRKPSRDLFTPGTNQPVYYIQYDRVLCYPDYIGGCSSCTPGRYCVSESTCILDEVDYPCAVWF